MTITELITSLQEIPQHRRDEEIQIYVDGDISGFLEIEAVELDEDDSSFTHKAAATTTKMKNQPEYQLQRTIAEYLRTAYKGVLFLSDVRASVKLTIPQAMRSKAIQADGFACPDLVIFEARREWHGMFLELKSKKPYKLDGELYADPHLEQQAKTLIELQEKGYHSDFYWRAEDAIQAIDWYLGKPNAADAMREIEQKIANGTKMTIETLDEYRYGK